MQSLDIKLNNSIKYNILIVLVNLCCLLGVIISVAAISLKLFLYVLILGIFTKIIFFSKADSFRLINDQSVIVRYKNSEVVAQISRYSFVSNYFCVLKYKASNGILFGSIVIFNDAVSIEQYRKLKVMLYSFR